ASVESKTRSAARGPLGSTGGVCMDFAISGRHVELTDALRASVTEKITKATRHLDGLDRAEVRFSEERNPRISEKEVCEVTIFGHGHIVRAKAAAADAFTAVDKVV